MNTNKENDEQILPSFKVLLLGSSFVGKTCILIRLTEDKYIDDYNVTIGLNYKIKKFKTQNNKEIRMQIWDTSGEEKFKSLAKNFYRGADGVILVYDICDKKSFIDVQNWINQIYENSGNDNIIISLVGNKVDKSDIRKVTKQEGELLAKEYQISFHECSAKTNLNIAEIFNDMANKISLVSEGKNKKNSVIHIGSKKFKKKISGCCSKSSKK